MNFQTPEEIRLTFLLFISMLLMAVFIACSAHAYVPNSQFIFSRVAAQHGRGAYLIEDEVTFKEGADTSIIKENWIVIDGGEMRLSAQGEGAKLFRIMKKGRLFWVDDTGSERSTEIPQGNIMRSLLTRSSTEEKKIFVNWGALPPEVFREKKLPKDIKDFHLESEPFVRLGRIGGVVAYAYGTPAPVDGAASPGVWIEQDQFNIRKLRTPDQSEILLNDYGAFSKGLVFPKSQIVSFDNHTATIRVARVSSIELSNDYKRQFDVNWLRGRPDIRSSWPANSLGPVIQEFFKRFR
jgi:hypothetical protein